MKAKMIRQGDVLLIPISDDNMLPIPAQGAARPVRVKARNGRIVLAQGETSMHEHTLAESDADLVRMGERMLINLYGPQRLAVTATDTGAELPRHTPIELPGGLYEVRTQRELQQVAGRLIERPVGD